jgi:hypothetical protein
MHLFSIASSGTVLSLLSEYGIPVVAEKLSMSIGMLEDYVADIYKKLEMTKEISTGSLN